MPRRGENIRKRKDGRWEGRFKTSVDSKVVYHSVYAKSYNEVKEKLALAKYNFHIKSDENANSERSIDFNRIALEWLDEIKSLRKRSTYEKYQNIYATYLVSILGDEQINAVTSELIYQRLPIGLSDSIYKSIFCILKQILDYGAMHYKLPPIKLQKCYGSNRKAPVTILDHTEQTRLLHVLSQNTDTAKLGILLCLFTGLRLGEICALKWSDIDMELRILHVNSTVQRLPTEEANKKTGLMEDTPKSVYSKREIPLSDVLYQLLAAFDTNQKYVVGGCKPMEPRTYQNKFKQYLKQAGIENKRFHVLRHTFATNCINSGADIKSISEILGHADVKITLNRYVHPTLDDKRKNMNALASIYGQNLGQISEKAD